MIIYNKLLTLYKENAPQMFPFIIVGLINTAIDFGIFLLLNNIFEMSYILSQLGGYSAGILNSFILNKFWTFKNHIKSQIKFYQFGMFLIINGVTLTITIISLVLLIDLLESPVIFAKVIIIVLTQVINFIGYKNLVFAG